MYKVISMSMGEIEAKDAYLNTIALNETRLGPNASLPGSTFYIFLLYVGFIFMIVLV